MRLFYSAAGLALSCSAIMPASAQDKASCGAGMVCASKPETVMAAMEKAGFKPKLSKDNSGDPMIESDEAAWSAATVHAAELFKDIDGTFRPGQSWSVEVMDEQMKMLRARSSPSTLAHPQRGRSGGIRGSEGSQRCS